MSPAIPHPDPKQSAFVFRPHGENEEILVLADHDPIFAGCRFPEGAVVGLCQSALQHVNEPHHARNDEAKRPARGAVGYPPGISRGDGENRVIHLPSRIGKRSGDILVLKKGIIRQNLLPGSSCRDQVEHIAHPETMPPDAGPPSAFARLDGDPLKQVHDLSMPAKRLPLNQEFNRFQLPLPFH